MTVPTGPAVPDELDRQLIKYLRVANDGRKKDIELFPVLRDLRKFVHEYARQERLNEVRAIPHQYDPKYEMHTMSDDPIPRVIECRCYKGRRIAQLTATPHEGEETV